MSDECNEISGGGGGEGGGANMLAASLAPVRDITPLHFPAGGGSLSHSAVHFLSMLF